MTDRHVSLAAAGQIAAGVDAHRRAWLEFTTGTGNVATGMLLEDELLRAIEALAMVYAELCGARPDSLARSVNRKLRSRVRARARPPKPPLSARRHPRRHSALADRDGRSSGGQAMTPATVIRRGPRGARVGDTVIAEGSRWLMEPLALERREAICRLLGGSGALRRFRARRIVAVEKAS
jgi:hypothetical protein